MVKPNNNIGFPLSLKVLRILFGLIFIFSSTTKFLDISSFQEAVTNFNAVNLPSGIYYYKLTTKGNSIVKRMLLLE